MSNWKATRDAAHAVGDGWGVWLLDKDQEPVGTLSGDLGWEFEESVDETTVARITLPETHPVFPIVLPFSLLEGSDPANSWHNLADVGYTILFEGPGGHTERMPFYLRRMRDNPRDGTFTLEGVHFRRWAERFPMWADPANGLIYQKHYHDFRRGDALRTIKTYFLVNMVREFQPGGVTGSDPWAPGNWQNVNPQLWPAMVNPVHKSTTTAQTILDARFDQASDLFKEPLEGAGLMLTVDLWLEGDPQPAPNHVTLTGPIIWVDVVPRQFDTSTTGDWEDFLTGLKRTFDRDNNAPIMGLGDTPATYSGHLPWVVWRPEHMKTITSELVITKSEYSDVIVGGRSPEAINKLVDATASITGSILGDLIYGAAQSVPVIGPVLAPIGRAIVTWFIGAVGESLQDKLFAWQRFTHHIRQTLQGRFAPRTAIGAGDGYTLAAWQQGFTMLKQGAGTISLEFHTDDSTPYTWGRDYRAGDQQGLVHRNLMFATYVHSVKLSRRPGGRVQAQPALGDPRARENAIKLQQRSVKAIDRAVSRVKTAIL